MVDTVPEPPLGKDSPDMAICQFGGFSFDPLRGVLRQPDGIEVSLRPKSAELLHHLARNATHVVGRNELMDTVWPGVIVTDDSITQCVAEIRRVLGADNAQLLRTLPKRGYMLAAAVTTGDPSPSEAAPPHNRAAADRAAAPPLTTQLPVAAVRHRWPRPAAWLGAGLGFAMLAGAVAWWSPAPQAPPLLPAQASSLGAGAPVAPEPASS